MKSILLVAFAFFALAASIAPLLHSDSHRVIPNEFLIILQANSSMEIRDAHIKSRTERFVEGESLLGVFAIGDFIGFSAKLTPASLAEERANPNVLFVEANQAVSIYDHVVHDVNIAPEADTTVTQTGATWGITRASQRALNLNGVYTYYSSAGANIDAYVIDTGIYIQHAQFDGGRAIWGANFVTGESNTDCNGHGTHVAGTIGGSTYGLAKKVTLYAVKVLSCSGSGTTAGVVNGINWVTTQYNSRKRPSVANMSLGGGVSQALDDAVVASINAGVSYAIAAGNSNANACTASPARVATAVTVGATDNTDTRASYSNFGTCVHIFAPGSSITSAWIGSTTATSTISGTSMAAPHVAGSIALHLAHITGTETPATTKAWATSTATSGIVKNAGTGSPNTFLFSPST